MNTAQHLKIVIHGNVQVFNTMPVHSLALSYPYEDDVLGEITKQRVEVTYNNSREHPNGKKAPNGIELRFGTARPTEEVRQMLRDHNYRFSEKQTMWYALDKGKARELATWLESNDIDVDTTQYEKRNFWARVKNHHEYEKLRERTEFYLKTEPPKNFYSKSYLNRAFNVHELIDNSQLYFKKYFNKVVGEEDDEGRSEEVGVDDELAEDDGQQTDTVLPSSPRQQNSNLIADKLEALADGMQEQINSKIHSATSQQRPTSRRMRIASGMRQDGYRLQDIQRVLYALATAHRDGSIKDYPRLQQIRQKSQVGLLNRYGYAIKENWGNDAIQRSFDHHSQDLSKLGINSVYEWSLTNGQCSELLQHTPVPQQEQETESQRTVREQEHQVFNMDIPGFFPTPRPLIERMLQLADIRSHQSILDPSAGKGDILDAIEEKFHDKDLSFYAAEINSTLRNILSKKGYGLVSVDFLSYPVVQRKFDRILMNPPFEQGQDADHVTHALQMLEPGGRLVAIVSEGLFFRKYKKEKAFRELLVRSNAYVSEPIKEGFRNAFHSTGVNVRIIAINQDGSPFDLPSADWQKPGIVDSDDDTNETWLLELEAEAELELLRMRVESERRKRQHGMNGITVDPDKLQRFRQKALAIRDNWQVSDFK